MLVKLKFLKIKLSNFSYFGQGWLQRFFLRAYVFYGRSERLHSPLYTYDPWPTQTSSKHTLFQSLSFISYWDASISISNNMKKSYPNKVGHYRFDLVGSHRHYDHTTIREHDSSICIKNPQIITLIRDIQQKFIMTHFKA